MAPAVLEDRLRAHPLVSQCMVVGDGRPYVAALVTLDRDAVPMWARANAAPVDVPKLVTAYYAEHPDPLVAHLMAVSRGITLQASA